MGNYSDEDFRVIVETYGDLVLRLAVSKLKNISDAEDLSQEVFVRLARHPEVMEDRLRLRLWLCRVTINLCKDHFKSRWMKYVSLAFGQRSDEESLWEDPRVDRISLQEWEVSMERENASMFLDQWMEQLNAEQRDLLHLFYYENFSAAEIAMAMKLNCGTVKTRLSRARDALRKNMKEARSV